MNRAQRFLIYGIVGIPIPIISGILYGFNWEVYTKKEAFPGSSTVFVWLTDGYHLMQFFYIKLFILSIVLYDSVFRWWIDGLIFLATWYIIFNIIYKTFSK